MQVTKKSTQEENGVQNYNLKSELNCICKFVSATDLNSLIMFKKAIKHTIWSLFWMPRFCSRKHTNFCLG